ncbi:hypothetical protein FB451DRAFT_1191087 [Mycena latifolia]|nr:hypothetical protein FB451DRAFT_1191087 [Mycena latifolia]
MCESTLAKAFYNSLAGPGWGRMDGSGCSNDEGCVGAGRGTTRDTEAARDTEYDEGHESESEYGGKGKFNLIETREGRNWQATAPSQWWSRPQSYDESEPRLERTCKAALAALSMSTELRRNHNWQSWADGDHFVFDNSEVEGVAGARSAVGLLR